MATVQIILSSTTIFDDHSYTTSSKWDGTSVATALSFNDQVNYQGYFFWGGFEQTQTINSFTNQSYAGYNTNWAGTEQIQSINSFTNQSYAGYNTNWDGTQVINITSTQNVDYNSVIDHPKDQTIYYKLKGYNPITQSYESWVISHNITARPSLDGGLFEQNSNRYPPNIERDIFKTPPSGNALVNIVIVSRWIE
jgi:hypothetical protein